MSGPEIIGTIIGLILQMGIILALWWAGARLIDWHHYRAIRRNDRGNYRGERR